MTHSLFSYRRFSLSLTLFSIGMISLWIVFFPGSDRGTGVDTLWIVDNSLSMGVEDMGSTEAGVIQSRIDAARALILAGMERIPGEHGALIYARSAGVLLPIGPVTEGSRKNIENITLVDDNGGSDISAAFSLLFSLYAERTKPLHLILISDGGDTSSSLLPPLPGHADLTIISIGTPIGGPIPLGYDALGKRRYKIYDGKEVIIPYEAKNIEKLSRNYTAKSYTLSTIEDQSKIIADLIPPMAEHDSRSSSFFFIFGTLCIILSLLIHPYVYVKSH